MGRPALLVAGNHIMINIAKRGGIADGKFDNEPVIREATEEILATGGGDLLFPSMNEEPPGRRHKTGRTEYATSSPCLFGPSLVSGSMGQVRFRGEGSNSVVIRPHDNFSGDALFELAPYKMRAMFERLDGDGSWIKFDDYRFKKIFAPPSATYSWSALWTNDPDNPGPYRVTDWNIPNLTVRVTGDLSSLRQNKKAWGFTNYYGMEISGLNIYCPRDETKPTSAVFFDAYGEELIASEPTPIWPYATEKYGEQGQRRILTVGDVVYNISTDYNESAFHIKGSLHHSTFINVHVGSGWRSKTPSYNGYFAEVDPYVLPIQTRPTNDRCGMQHGRVERCSGGAGIKGRLNKTTIVGGHWSGHGMGPNWHLSNSFGTRVVGIGGEGVAETPAEILLQNCERVEFLDWGGGSPNWWGSKHEFGDGFSMEDCVKCRVTNRAAEGGEWNQRTQARWNADSPNTVSLRMKNCEDCGAEDFDVPRNASRMIDIDESSRAGGCYAYGSVWPGGSYDTRNSP